MIASKAGKSIDAHSRETVTISVRGKDGKPVLVKISRAELIRRAMAAEVAKVTVHLANNVHTTEAGRRISLDPQWEEIYADPSTDVRIIAPAQRGKTLYELVKTMAQLSLGMSVGWVMPKWGKVQELVNGKLNGTIKNTPAYQELQDESSGHDTIGFKTFGEFGRLYLVTANSENELTSFSADAMHVDERDFCNRTNLPMYTSRMNASPYRLTDEISTPTVEGTETRLGQPGNDNIHSEWLGGDQQRYYVPCPHCGTWQVLDWFDNVVEVETDETGRVTGFDVRDKGWSPGAAVDLSVCCRSCGRPFDRLARGEWRANRPGRRIRSRWVEALSTSLGPPLEQMLATYTKAIGNPTKMQHFHNMDLGRPFAGGMLRFTRQMFEGCTDQKHWMLGESDGPCTIGIDVNRPWLDVQISRWIGGKQIKVWAGKVRGAEGDIVKLSKRYGVVGGIIDHQPDARYATQVQDDLASEGIHLVRCKYATTDQARMVVVTEAGENPKLDPPRLITVNKTVAVDSLFETMQTKMVVWFRDWEQAIEGAMLEEFTTPTRKLVVNDAGTERFIWEGKPDHQLHAAVYDMLAGSVLKMNVERDYGDVIPCVNTITHGGGSIVPPTPPGDLRDDAVMIQRG